MGLKWTEILLILFALMLLFGTTRLPQLGKSLGSAIRNFKKGFTSDEPEDPAAPGAGQPKVLAEAGQVPATPAGTPDKAPAKNG